MPNQEVILSILELLETMEEGIEYIEEKLQNLDIESSTTVLQDTINAFSAIEAAVTPMVDQLEENEILEKTEELKGSFNRLVKEYEKDNGQEFTQINQLSLKPVFENWKTEIELRLRPYVVS